MFIVLRTFVIVGMSNAVNLTDGLDGLAIMPAVIVGAALGVFAYATGNAIVRRSTSVIPYDRRRPASSLIFCAALVGAGLGFLWFNTYPAQVFMGDIGALALGARARRRRGDRAQELVLLIMGGIFVVETVSVILQVASFKLTGKRIFRMAPIHHHFELKGWAEPKVIVRFWIITLMLVLIGLATLEAALMAEERRSPRARSRTTVTAAARAERARARGKIGAGNVRRASLIVGLGATGVSVARYLPRSASACGDRQPRGAAWARRARQRVPQLPRSSSRRSTRAGSTA